MLIGKKEKQAAINAGFFDKKVEHKKETNLVLMIILLVLSGAGIIAAFFSSEGTAGLFIVATIMLGLAILATIYSNKSYRHILLREQNQLIKYVVLRKC